MIKDKTLEALKDRFESDVLGIYDKRNKTYFHHDHSDHENIFYCGHRGEGEPLARKGASLVCRVVELSEPSFKKAYRTLKKTADKLPYWRPDGKREIKRDQLSSLDSYRHALGKLQEGECKIHYQIDYSPYINIYEGIVAFPELTSEKYVQASGEMVFHLLRVLNMCHGGLCDPIYRTLDKILQIIPDKGFLGEERLKQFGEGLVKEILRSDIESKQWAFYDDALPSQKAGNALYDYRIDNEALRLLWADILSLETNHRLALKKIRQQEVEEIKRYKEARKSILEAPSP